MDLAHYTDFGKVAAHYQRGRKALPDDVLDFLGVLLGPAGSRILDIASGTGIVTRQLVQRGFEMVGCDISWEMLWTAKQESTQGIWLVVASAHALPFGMQRFDGVTITSAFHWFANQSTLGEIKRVSKDRAPILIINKYDQGDFRQKVNELFEQFFADHIPNVKEHYDPTGLLVEAGFNNVQRSVFEAVERYTTDEAMEYLCSRGGIWAKIREQGQESNALGAVQEFVRARLINGVMERPVNIVLVSGLK